MQGDWATITKHSQQNNGLLQFGSQTWPCCKTIGHLGEQFGNKRYNINGKISRRSFTIYEVHDNNLNKTVTHKFGNVSGDIRKDTLRSLQITGKDWNILLNSHCMINNTIINAVNSLLHQQYPHFDGLFNCNRTRISSRVFAIINKHGGVILNTLWNITLDIFVYRDTNDYICIFDSIGGTFTPQVQQQTQNKSNISVYFQPVQKQFGKWHPYAIIVDIIFGNIFIDFEFLMQIASNSDKYTKNTTTLHRGGVYSIGGGL